MEPQEILSWVMKRINFIRNNKNHITFVSIFNTEELKFGKKYYIIYFKIKTNAYLTVKPPEKLTEKEKKLNEIVSFDDYTPEYISFYKNNYTEKEVETNYKWILTLFENLIEEWSFEHRIRIFENESMRRAEDKLREK